MRHPGPTEEATDEIPLARGRLAVPSQAREYARLMRLHRPIGAFLLLWPTLWALWIAAEGPPPPAILAVFVLGVWVMRAAGCVINDYADRELDPQVERTRDRPLALGTVRPREALVLFMALMLVALGLVLTLNWPAIGLAAAAAVLAVVYPFLKRVTHLPQVWLGVAFGWGIPMGFAAVTGAVPPIGWALLLANVLWAIAYDTMYAMADRPDDIRAGSHSTAIMFGRADRAIGRGLSGLRRRRAGRDRVAARLRPPLVRGARGSGMFRSLPATPHPRAGSGRLLAGLHEQQLAWRRHLPRARRGVRDAGFLARKSHQLSSRGRGDAAVTRRTDRKSACALLKA